MTQTSQQSSRGSTLSVSFHSFLFLFGTFAITVNRKEVSLFDSDIEVRSVDGFIFQLHRVVLGVTTGVFPGSEIDTDGEMVQLTEPAKVLGILFAFIYPKVHPDLHGECFETLAAVAEAAGKYEVFSAVYACNERLLYVVLGVSSRRVIDDITAYL